MTTRPGTRKLSFRLLALLGACALSATLASFIPGFLTSGNLSDVLVSSVPLLVLATGQTYVVMTAGIDLSATAVVGLASALSGLAMTLGFAEGTATVAFLGFAIAASTGLTVGTINGALIAKLHLPPFMATLGTGMFASGLGLYLLQQFAGSLTLYGLPDTFITLGGHALGTLLVGCLIAGVAEFVLVKTSIGLRLRAIGSNRSTALISGVAVNKLTAATYALSGLLAGIASVALTARLETASSAHGAQMFLDVIAAVVIGGTSLFGGRGSIVGTALGVLFLSIAGNALSLMGLADFLIAVFKGTLLLTVALLDRVMGERP